MRQDGQRHLVVVERVAAVGDDRLDARRGDRIARRGERQLVDDHAAQLLADHVHALPERRGRQQHGVRRGAELIQQHAPRRRALHEQRIGQRRLDAIAHRAQHRVAGEQHERAALACASADRSTSRATASANSGDFGDGIWRGR